MYLEEAQKRKKPLLLQYSVSLRLLLARPTNCCPVQRPHWGPPSSRPLSLLQLILNTGLTSSSHILGLTWVQGSLLTGMAGPILPRASASVLPGEQRRVDQTVYSFNPTRSELGGCTLWTSVNSGVFLEPSGFIRARE